MKVTTASCTKFHGFSEKRNFSAFSQRGDTARGLLGNQKGFIVSARSNPIKIAPTARPGVSGRIARFVLRLISHDIIIFFNLLLISHTLLLELMVCGLVATVTRVF